MKARVDDRPAEEATDAVDVAEHGRSADGETHPCDVILYATGFDATGFVAPTTCAYLSAHPA